MDWWEAATAAQPAPASWDARTRRAKIGTAQKVWHGERGVGHRFEENCSPPAPSW